MIITAKFSSTCPRCGQFIDAGDRVEWTKGTKAAHAKCPTAASSSPAAPRAAAKPAAPRAPKEPSVEAAPYQRGEKWEPCKRSALPDTTGEVRVAKATKRAWAGLRAGAIGELALEGEAFVVVAQTSYYESAEQNEDMGDMSGPGWHVTLYLRRATAEEAAPALAKAASTKAVADAKALRAAQIKELKKICEEGWRTSDNEAKCPSGRQVELDPGVHGGRTIAILSEDGFGVAVWCGGFYDDYRETLQISREPRAVELMTTLLGVLS